MRPELAKWRSDFEKKWGCSLKISSAPKDIRVDESKLPVCPLCEEPIYENQEGEIGIADGIKTLIHSNCD